MLVIWLPLANHWCKLNQAVADLQRCDFPEMCSHKLWHNSCAFTTRGEAMYESAERSNLKSPGGFPSTQHCLDSYDYPTKSGAEANGVLLFLPSPSSLRPCQTHFMQCYLSMNSEWNLPELLKGVVCKTRKWFHICTYQWWLSSRTLAYLQTIFASWGPCAFDKLVLQ